MNAKLPVSARLGVPPSGGFRTTSPKPTLNPEPPPPNLTLNPTPNLHHPLSTKRALASTLLAALAFHIAWLIPTLASCTLLYAYFLIQLSSHSSARVVFRLGFLNGLLIFAPHLAWFWNIFGFAAPCLWSVLAFFTAAFVLLLHLCRRHFGTKLIWLVAPILWTGLEYFRSEVYFLKFSWLALGYAFSENAGASLGVYGTAFVIFLIAGIITNIAANRSRYTLPIILALVTLFANVPPLRITAPSGVQLLHVAGIQLEFPPALEIPKHLDRLIAQYPQAQLLVLSEYTFDSSIPQQVRDWCRRNNRYLIAGGKDDSVPGNFYNTAFVVGPTGEIIFQQAKSVPIQFFADGLPASSQEVWNSPWGKIAIPVCYDLSYRRVMDRFVQSGAQAIIVPFMDVTDWGAQQHELHARIAPVRALEYSVPIFRIGSSGISQNIDSYGCVLASLPYPGHAQTLAASIHVPTTAHLPLDHWLAPACSIVTAALLIFVVMKTSLFRSFARSE